MRSELGVAFGRTNTMLLRESVGLPIRLMGDERIDTLP